MAGRHDEEGRDLMDQIIEKHSHSPGTSFSSPSPNRIGPPMSNKALQQAINDTFDMWCECDLNQKPPERLYNHLNHLLNMQAARSRLIFKEQNDE